MNSSQFAQDFPSFSPECPTCRKLFSPRPRGTAGLPSQPWSYYRDLCIYWRHGRSWHTFFPAHIPASLYLYLYVKGSIQFSLSQNSTSILWCKDFEFALVMSPLGLGSKTGGFLEFVYSFPAKKKLLWKNWEGRNLDLRGKKSYL